MRDKTTPYLLILILLFLTSACAQSEVMPFPETEATTSQASIETLTPPASTSSVPVDTLRTVRSGHVSAILYRDGSLHLTRSDDLSQTIEAVVAEYEPDDWIPFPYDLQIHDLDGNDEPEIVLLVSTPGASCCTTLTVFYYDAASQSYHSTDTLFRKYTIGFDIIDIDGDGVVEIRTLNEDFNYALGGATVVSTLSPLQILAYAEGQFVDVVDRFPDLLTTQIEIWDREDELLCETFAAGTYLAEMYRLNRGAEGWEVIATRCQFALVDVQLIRDGLVEFGYAPTRPKPPAIPFETPAPPLNWSVEITQAGSVAVEQAGEVTLQPAPWTLQLRLPQPLAVRLVTTQDEATFERIQAGRDVDGADLPLSPGWVLPIDNYFGQCRCLKLSPDASQYLYYENDQDHQWNRVTIEATETIFERDVWSFIDVASAESPPARLLPSDFAGQQLYLALWLDYREPNFINEDELKKLTVRFE